MSCAAWDLGVSFLVVPEESEACRLHGDCRVLQRDDEGAEEIVQEGAQRLGLAHFGVHEVHHGGRGVASHALASTCVGHERDEGGHECRHKRRYV